MKRGTFLIVSYLLVFSLLGIGILQYLFINKQQELVEKQIIYNVSNALSDIEWQLKKIEIKEALPYLDSLGVLPNEQIGKQFQFNLPVIECDKDSTNIFQTGIYELYDSIGKISPGYLQDSRSNPVLRKLLLQMYYQFVTNNFPRNSITKKFDTTEVRKIIQNVFKEKRINVPFEFAIFHDGIETTVKSPGFRNNPHKFLLISHELYPDSGNPDHFKLVLAIDKKKIYKNNILLFQILSYLFTAFVLISFLITIFNMMRQRHLNELKNDFINNITHEFKTPIATMNLAIDSIKSPSVINNPEKIKHYLNILKTENNRMLDQVEKILFLAKLEQGKVIWNNQTIDIHEIIQEALEHLKLILKSKQAKINLQLNADNPYVKGDPIFIFDMLINLLDNAIKYSPNEVNITISTENSNGQIILKIADKGVGMSKEVYENIFEKFYRKPTGNVHNIKGHGIGLTFVKQVVQKMKGKIKVKSQPGKGTTFIISLPVENKTENKTNNQ